MATDMVHIAVGFVVIQTCAAIYDGTRAVDRWLSPIPIEGTGYVDGPVHAGDTVTVTWELIKRSECSGGSSRVWRGENGFYLVEPRRETAIPVSEVEQIYHIPTDIPRGAPEGLLTLEVVGSYNCHDLILGEDHFSLGPVVMEVVK